MSERRTEKYYHWEDSLLRFVLVTLLGAFTTGFVMALFSRSIDMWSFMAGGAVALLADRLQRHNASTFTISYPAEETITGLHLFDDPEPDEGGPRD